MRTIVSVLFVLVVFSGAAQAQPGQTPTGPMPAPEAGPPPQQPYPPPPQPYPPPPQPYPPPPYPQQQPQPYPYPPPAPYPPPPGYPPPYQYPTVQLTLDEQKLLAAGEISLTQHAGGVAANWLLGFGVGHMIQGRWSDKGWIFTLGEAAGITMIVVGISRLHLECDDLGPCSYNNNDDAGVLIVGGLIGYVTLHVWSVIDAAIGPANHNRKVRDLKRRVGIPVVGSKRIIPYTSRPRDGGGTVGLTFRF